MSHTDPLPDQGMRVQVTEAMIDCAVRAMVAENVRQGWADTRSLATVALTAALDQKQVPMGEDEC